MSKRDEHIFQFDLAYWKENYLLAVEVGQGIVNRVRVLHRPVSVDVLPWKCYQGDCDHDGECPIEDMSVCRECHGIACAVDDEQAAINEVMWPCPPAQALGVQSEQRPINP